MRRPQADAPLVALTGASGFLGSHIAETLLAEGYRVRAALRPRSETWRLEGLALETIIAPLDDPAAVDALLDGASSLIHCAGVIRSGSEDGYEQGNVRTTRCLIEAGRRSGVLDAFVLISSLAASGPNAPGRPLVPRRESDPCRPITAYGRSKLRAEALLEETLPFRCAILRPPALYGPRDTAFLPLFKAAAKRLSMRAGNIRRLSLLDGRDCARAAVLLMSAPTARGAYFVSDQHSYSFADMAAALGAAFGHRVLTIPLPMLLLHVAATLVGRDRASELPLLAPDRLRDAAAAAWVCDDHRLRSELGFSSTRDLETGFRETLADYRRTGRIQQ